jgi:DNA-binding transcriptional MerR regulator
MAATAELLKIGDFARLAGTNLRTLRYYEEVGLIAPASRSGGGFRYYRRSDAHRVALIHDLQALGLALERIRELVRVHEAPVDRASFLSRVRAALCEHARLIDAKVSALEEQRGRVASALAKLGQCEGCVHSPTDGEEHCRPCARTGEPLPDLLSALF